jgi:hypothetical protein
MTRAIATRHDLDVSRCQSMAGFWKGSGSLEQKNTKATKQHQRQAFQTRRRWSARAQLSLSFVTRSHRLNHEAPMLWDNDPLAHPDRVELPADWRDLLVRYRGTASRAEWVSAWPCGSRDLVWIVARSRKSGSFGYAWVRMLTS